MGRAVDYLLRLAQRLMIKLELYLYSLCTFIHLLINTHKIVTVHATKAYSGSRGVVPSSVARSGHVGGK